MYNWATLNQKVFRRLGFAMDKIEIDTVVNCKPGAVEILLMRLQRHIADIRAGRRAGPSNASPLGANGSAGFAGAISAGAGAEAAAFSQQQYSNAMNAAGPSASTMQSTSLAAVDANIVAEKDATIKELHETIDILELKVKKLEQVRATMTCMHRLSCRLMASKAARLSNLTLSSPPPYLTAHPTTPTLYIGHAACKAQRQPYPDAHSTADRCWRAAYCPVR